MNFIGHLHVALWYSSIPAHGLGAMLPDFASMAGVRLPALCCAGASTHSEHLARGVALHHQTDAVFHSTPTFVELMAQTSRELLARNVPRGAARAIAHVGVEMLIDGELLATPELGAHYLHALDAVDVSLARFDAHASAHEPRLDALNHLIERLRSYGIPTDYRNTEAVVVRLSRMLARRPRLALDEDAEQAARTVLGTIQQQVRTRLDTLLYDLGAGLRDSPAHAAARTEAQESRESL